MTSKHITANNTDFVSGRMLPHFLKIMWNRLPMNRDKLCKLIALCFYSNSMPVDPTRIGLQSSLLSSFIKTPVDEKALVINKTRPNAKYDTFHYHHSSQSYIINR